MRIYATAAPTHSQSWERMHTEPEEANKMVSVPPEREREKEQDKAVKVRKEREPSKQMFEIGAVLLWRSAGCSIPFRGLSFSMLGTTRVMYR